jgi:hypothetical protein
MKKAICEICGGEISNPLLNICTSASFPPLCEKCFRELFDVLLERLELGEMKPFFEESFFGEGEKE